MTAATCTGTFVLGLFGHFLFDGVLYIGMFALGRASKGCHHHKFWRKHEES